MEFTPLHNNRFLENNIIITSIIFYNNEEIIFHGCNCHVFFVRLIGAENRILYPWYSAGTRDNGEDATKNVSLVVTATPENVAVVMNTENGKTVYTTDQLTVSVENGKVSFSDAKGNLLMTEGEYAFTPRHTGPDRNSYKVKQTFSVEPHEAIYGIGMLQNGKLNQRGEQRRMEQSNIDDYAHFYQSIKGYGVYWDNYSPTLFQCPKMARPANSSLNRK